MSFNLANVGGRAALVKGEHYYDLESWSDGVLTSDPMLALGTIEKLHEMSAALEDASPTGKLADVRLDAPVPRPPQCFGIGLNYRNHAAESNMPIPSVPLTFTKFPASISGPNDDVQMRSDFVDYEGELVVVIGKAGKDIALANALDHVAGLCVGQDFSDRAVQFASQPPQFSLGKSFETFSPIGPYVVSLDELPEDFALRLTTDVNGEARQNDSTGDLIFDIPGLVSYLSNILPLQVGDVIFTGTPGGVGVAKMKFLADGDMVTTAIEGLGTLHNRCVRASDHPNADKIPEFFKKAKNKK